MNCSPPGSQWDKIVRQEFYLISVQYIQRQLSTPILVNNCWLLLRRWVSNSTTLSIRIWTHFDRVSQKKDQNHKDVTRNSQMCHMSQNMAKDVACHKESKDVTRCTMKSRMSRVAQWSPGCHASHNGVQDVTCHKSSQRYHVSHSYVLTLKMALAQCICSSWFSLFKFLTRSSIIPSVRMASL